MQCIIVTGASGGVGCACAKALAGPKVTLALQFNKNSGAAQRLKEELLQAGAHVHLFQADLAKSNEAKSLIGRVAAEAGEPTMLVHAAGQFLEKPIVFTKPDEWDTLMNLHAISV